MISENEKQEADRLYHNLHVSPVWSGTLAVNQIDYLLQNRPDIVICNGHVRKVKVSPITQNTYRIETESL